MTRAGSSGVDMPDLDGAGLRIGIISARFNDHIVVPLRDGARRALARTGVLDGDVLEAWVPGAFELPLAAKALAETGKVDAIICVGTVIRGDTPHFDYVCSEAARGIQQAQLDTGVPVMFSVLTVDTEQQALDRVEGRIMTNKGEEAAEGAVEMALLLKCLRA
ncbi:MAG: 6,7-dimethyl-8-ribityllumazine synthase [Actinomycetota bacterium]